MLQKFESLSEVRLFWSPWHWNACAHFKLEHCTWCPNVGAKFRSQYLSHMMPNLGGIYLLLRTRWQLCTTWSHTFGKNECTCYLLCYKGKTPKMTSCDPSSFEGNGLHLNLLKKPQIFGSSSFVIHTTYYDKIVSFLKFCGMTKMIMKSSILRFSLAAPWMKGMFICQTDLANVVQLTLNFLTKWNMVI